MIITHKKKLLLFYSSFFFICSQHPNITALYGVAQRDGALLLVMEFVNRGEFYPLLKDKNIKWPWPKRVKAAHEVASALALVHSKGLMHRDIKSENLLVAENW